MDDAAAADLFTGSKAGKGANFKVVVRVRPHNDREQGSQRCVDISGPSTISVNKARGWRMEEREGEGKETLLFASPYQRSFLFFFCFLFFSFFFLFCFFLVVI
jgi:hypothetical protein